MKCSKENFKADFEWDGDWTGDWAYIDIGYINYSINQDEDFIGAINVLVYADANRITPLTNFVYNLPGNWNYNTATPRADGKTYLLTLPQFDNVVEE